MKTASKKSMKTAMFDDQRLLERDRRVFEKGREGRHPIVANHLL
jgi:hypothetical protein